jgi:predicted ATPase/DNA-binding SARP family transcriptional activator
VQTLEIRLFGGFRLLYNEQPISMVHQLRLQSLLAYLVMHRELPHPRQQLAFLFWPDVSEKRARANLRKALYELRKVLPNLDEIVQIEDHYLQWRNATDPDFSAMGAEKSGKTVKVTDVERFAASLAQVEPAKQPEVARAALEEAVSLYVGDLLPACYDDWVLIERERLRQRYVNALEQLIAILEQHELASALAHAQRLLHCDSLHESTYRVLMRLHVLNGDRATALHIYHTCVTLLQQELGVEPSPETQQLYQHLLNMPATPLMQSSATSPVVKPTLSLVGRQPEWRALQSAWSKAVAGTAHCVLIAGEAGIGKTRLAEELLQWADRQGYATARTRSYAAEGRLAYAPITDWLRSAAIRARFADLEQVWLVEVARLVPELLVEYPDLPPSGQLTDSWQRQRFREALVRALVSSRQPLLLVIDDLQWSDSETLEWLHYLLRQAAREPILVVGTVRPEEVEADHPLTPLLRNLRQAGQLTDIELTPLSSSETVTLASQVGGDALTDEQAALLYRQTEGHPLFVVEMLRARQNQGTGSEQASITASYALPPKVQTVIESRLAQLSPRAREVAGLAATVGRVFTVEVLAQASDGDEDGLVRALDELWQRRLIREQGDSGYDFSHDRIREAAYTSVSSARRRLFHRRVAQAMEQIFTRDLNSICGELAAHYEYAGLPERAVIFYQQAAEVAQRIYAHAEASTYLIKALELLDRLPVTQEHLQQELRLRMAQAISLTALKGGSGSEVKDVYTRAQELAMQVGDEPVRFAALDGLFVDSVTRGQLQEAQELVQQQFALAEQTGDISQIADARGSLGIVHFYLGQWTSCRTLLEQSLYRSHDQSFYATPLIPAQHLGLANHRHLSVALWHLGYPDQALEQMQQAMARAEALSHPTTLVSTYGNAARLYQYRRETALVQSQAETTITLCLQHGFSDWLDQSSIYLGWALIQQGQIEEGMACMHRAFAIRWKMATGLAQPERLARLAEAYGQVGEPEEALRVLNEALDMVEATGARYTEAELYRLKGELLHKQAAEPREVEYHFLHALAIARKQEAKSPELRVALSLSKLWQQQGRSQDARALLAEIYGWFTEGFDTPDLVDARFLLEELS